MAKVAWKCRNKELLPATAEKSDKNTRQMSIFSVLGSDICIGEFQHCFKGEKHIYSLLLTNFNIDPLSVVCGFENCLLIMK